MFTNCYYISRGQLAIKLSIQGVCTILNSKTTRRLITFTELKNILNSNFPPSPYWNFELIFYDFADDLNQYGKTYSIFDSSTSLTINDIFSNSSFYISSNGIPSTTNYNDHVTNKEELKERFLRPIIAKYHIKMGQDTGMIPNAIVDLFFTGHKYIYDNLSDNQFPSGKSYFSGFTVVTLVGNKDIYYVIPSHLICSASNLHNSSTRYSTIKFIFGEITNDMYF